MTPITPEQAARDFVWLCENRMPSVDAKCIEVVERISVYFLAQSAVRPEPQGVREAGKVDTEALDISIAWLEGIISDEHGNVRISSPAAPVLFAAKRDLDRQRSAAQPEPADGRGERLKSKLGSQLPENIDFVKEQSKKWFTERGDMAWENGFSISKTIEDVEIPDGNYSDVKIDECPPVIYLDTIGRGTWMDKQDGKWRLKYVREDLSAPQPASNAGERDRLSLPPDPDSPVHQSINAFETLLKCDNLNMAQRAMIEVELRKARAANNAS